MSKEYTVNDIKEFVKMQNRIMEVISDISSIRKEIFDRFLEEKNILAYYSNPCYVNLKYQFEENGYEDFLGEDRIFPFYDYNTEDGHFYTYYDKEISIIGESNSYGEISKVHTTIKLEDIAEFMNLGFDYHKKRDYIKKDLLPFLEKSYTEIKEKINKKEDDKVKKLQQIKDEMNKCGITLEDLKGEY